MKKNCIIGCLICCLVVLAAPAGAVQDTATLTINATVNAKAKLTISPTTINFPDADPTSTTSIPADSAVSVTAQVRTGSNANPTLVVKALNDLISGSDVIDISNVTWTATGTGFVNGTLVKGSDVNVASWTGSSPGQGYTGSLSFKLANSYAYPTGSFTAQAVFTLTAP